MSEYRKGHVFDDDQTRDDGTDRRQGGGEHPVTFGVGQKMVGFAMVLVTSTLSVGGSYLAFKGTTDLRLAEIEKRVDHTDVRVAQMEAIGHPDHERRVTKLETRMDDNDRTISDIKSKLDVIAAILQRIEVKVDASHKTNQ